jgi:hypothetical protein
MMVTGERADIRALFLAALIAALVGLLPGIIGMLASFVVLLVLLSKWTSVDVFPGGILVVIIANFLGNFLGMMLLAAIG